MNIERFLASSALRSAAVIGFMAAMAAPAHAQVEGPVVPGGSACQAPAGQEEDCPDTSGPDATAATTTEAETSTAGGEGITVVGSRTRRNEFNTADPVQIVNRDEQIAAGFNSAAEILQSTQVTGGSGQINNVFGGFVTAGGPGANTLGLRGLGTSRTLILLNGRRLTPAGTRGQVGAVDLNVLPNAIIDRFEILNTGASSIYGSDAVAGVVNIVTRNQMDGIYLEGQHVIPLHGEGTTQRYSLSGGMSTSRLRLLASLEYYDRQELQLGDRKFGLCQQRRIRASADQPFGSGDPIDPLTGQSKCYPTGALFGEDGVTINTIGTPNLPASAVALAPGVPAGYTGTCNRFRPNINAGGQLTGYECVGGGTLDLNVRDTFSKALLTQALYSPQKTYTAFFQAQYETGILGNMEIYTEFLGNRRTSDQVDQRQLTLDYTFGSPLIPAGLKFATPFAPAQPSGTTNGQPIGIRLFIDYGNYQNRQEVDYKKGLVGVRGDLFGGWRYDGYISKGWADGEYTTDLLLIDRMSQTQDVVVGANGQLQCKVQVAACVPAPAITPALIGGQLPQAWFNYVTAPVTGTTKFREQIISLGVDGPLFNMPGGPVQVALGFEQRKDSLNDTPGEDSINGNLAGFTSSLPTIGSDQVWEVFGEIDVPILSDVPFFHRLSVNGSARYTEYESYGGDETWKVGGLWAPTPWISFRGSYGTSYRAPTLFEQFLGATTGFQAAQNDPCTNVANLPAGSVVKTNCLTEVPANFVQNNGITVNQKGGAEAGLEAERSKNWTVGGVFQPKLGGLGDFSFAVDYWTIKINQGVSQLGFLTILNSCYGDPEFRSGQPLCNFVARSSTGQLTVTTGYINVSQQQASGWDFNARYVMQLGDAARFRLNATATKFDRRRSRTLATSPFTEFIGSVNNPEWTADVDANLDLGKWTLRYGVEWIDSTYTTAEFLNISQATRDLYDYETEDYFLHNASVRYQADRFGIILGVRNLFDRDPPTISSGFFTGTSQRIANGPLYSGYDVIGRRVFVNVTTNFR